jgi:hypothetical protein
MNELTQRGIQALRSGDRSGARTLLTAAIQADPNDVTAWLWLTGALDTDGERVACLRQVLRIDPNNSAAARGLKQILDRQAAGITTPPPAQEQPAPESAPAPADLSAMREAYTEAAVDTDEADDSAPIILDAELDAVIAAAAPAIPLPAEQELPPTPVAARQEVAATGLAGGEAPAGARRRAHASNDPARLIFRTRPSVAPALGAFWMFAVGVIMVGLLLQSAPELATTLSIGLGVLLLAIVVYAVVRNMAARYELTNHALTLRFRGKRVRVPIADLFAVDCRQGFFQKLLGTGDVLLDASVNGELSHLKLRNIPNCPHRVQQIEEQIREAQKK